MKTESPTAKGYALYVFGVILILLLINRCGEWEEAGARARSIGTEATIVEEWPWE